MVDGKKTAIVCDWLTGIGGAEQVLLELHKLFPDAPIYTSQYNPEKIDWFVDADVRTGWLQKFPSSLKKLLPVLRAWYFGRLDLSEYNLIISSNTGAEAKGIKTHDKQTHICYMHAPTHYYWSRYDDYMRSPGWGMFDWLGRLGLRLLIKPMRRWDYRAAQRPDVIIANSSHTQAAINKYYDRDSTIVYPPADVEYFRSMGSAKRYGFVITGRQTPYKRFDLAIATCTQLGLPLTVIGDGPEYPHLREMAGPSITFRGLLRRSEVREVLQASEGFIFPGLDDFGIAAVDALASGTPVIAYRAGGALDYVVEGKNGLFFDEQSVNSLVLALKKFQDMKFDNQKVTKTAEKFSTKNFRTSMQHFIEKIVN